jgi:hypothetical protein
VRFSRDGHARPLWTAYALILVIRGLVLGYAEPSRSVCCMSRSHVRCSANQVPTWPSAGKPPEPVRAKRIPGARVRRTRASLADQASCSIVPCTRDKPEYSGRLLFGHVQGPSLCHCISVRAPIADATLVSCALPIELPRDWNRVVS